MIDLISQHIITLLRRHDCVIVPGVGAFVAVYESASIAGKVMTPPQRLVTFNPALAHDDGLLASSVSRRLKISFEQARERVEAEVALIQRRLKAEGALHLPYVGTLQRMSDGRLDFHADAAWTLSLPAVHSVEAAPTFEVVRPSANNDDKAVAVVRMPLRLRWLRVAAAALILGTLGFMLSTPIDIEQAQHASLAAPQFTAPEPVTVPELSVPDISLAIAKAPAEQVAAMPEAPSEPAPAPVADGKYVVVIASLPTLEKAREFIESQTLSSLQILQSGDKFRVYAASGATADQAQAAAAAIDGFAANYPDAWVCRR